ncbi:MAG: trehalose-phosphatase [Halodesulfurarchaeum sp.]
MPSSAEAPVPHLRSSGHGSKWVDPFVDAVAGADRLFVFSDFDGTLAPIRSDPDDATIRTDAADALAALSGVTNVEVGVISGRSLDDLRDRLGIPDVALAGNHGLEIAVHGETHVHPEAAECRTSLDQVVEALSSALGDDTGVEVENKGLTASVHVRRVEDVDAATIRPIVEGILDDPDADLTIVPGKQVLELRPDIEWGKGRGVEWILEELQFDPADSHAIYLGDDVTDEPAFQVVEPFGTGIVVGAPTRDTNATYRLDGPGEVASLLSWIVSAGPSH